MNTITDDQAAALLKTASEDPKLYNRISNILYSRLNVVGAVPVLLCTFVVKVLIKEGVIEYVKSE